MTWPTPIALFDLDGTLCNVEHRVPFINGRHDFDVPKGGNIHATWKCRKCGSYVVDMWRSEGLLCLQVAPGDF